MVEGEDAEGHPLPNPAVVMEDGDDRVPASRLARGSYGGAYNPQVCVCMCVWETDGQARESCDVAPASEGACACARSIECARVFECISAKQGGPAPIVVRPAS